jgi:cobalt transporter subunit CbtA
MRRILLTALVAAFIAGLAAFAAQLLQAIPLIAVAETFEIADPVPQRAAAHAHTTEAWEPAEGFERQAFTAVADILVAFGFALILVGLFALRGHAVDARQGLLWGLAGFAAFTLAPAFGLPPELPGSQAAELGLRQLWWLGTAITTAGALAMMVFGRSHGIRVAAVALLLAPHIIGAPHVHEHGGTAPPELAAQFIVASLMASAVFWIVLGTAAGWLYGRLSAR